MQYLPLSNSHKETMISDEDYHICVKYNWYLIGNGYPSTSIGGYDIYLHKFVGQRMGLDPNKEIDHKDRNLLNNQRTNLRNCTRSQNNVNRPISPRNMSGYKGVCLDNRTGKYKSRIHNNKRSYYLGTYYTIEEAALAYARAAKRMYGEFSEIYLRESGLDKLLDRENSKMADTKNPYDAADDPSHPGLQQKPFSAEEVKINDKPGQAQPAGVSANTQYGEPSPGQIPGTSQVSGPTTYPDPTAHPDDEDTENDDDGDETGTI